jgi:hypothetical protein
MYVDETASAASVAANIIDGQNYHISSSGNINGCYVTIGAGGGVFSGIEGGGSSNRYSDNEVFNNKGGGMTLQGESGSWSGLQIQGYDPFVSGTQIYRYIHSNTGSGILIKGAHGPSYCGSSCLGTTSGVQFDTVNIAGNSGYAIEAYDAVATSIGFTYGSTTHICDNNGSSGTWSTMVYEDGSVSFTYPTSYSNVTTSCAY